MNKKLRKCSYLRYNRTQYFLNRFSFFPIYCVSALYHVQANKHRVFTAIFAINIETEIKITNSTM
jgi:hypothetical protein